MIKAEFLVESVGRKSQAVESSLESYLERIRGEEGIEVESYEIGEVEEEEDVYSGVLEMELSFKDLESYIQGVLKYPPSALILHNPESVTLGREDFQELITWVGGILRKFYSAQDARFIFQEAEGEPEAVDEEEIENYLQEGAIRVGVMVEKGKQSLEIILSRVLSSLEGDVDYIKAEEMELEVGEVAALDLLIHPPSAIVEMMVKHLPVVVKIVEPREIKLSMLDLQEVGITIAEMVNSVIIQKASSGE